jgi:hypothetical protein
MDISLFGTKSIRASGIEKCSNMVSDGRLYRLLIINEGQKNEIEITLYSDSENCLKIEELGGIK